MIIFFSHCVYHFYMNVKSLFGSNLHTYRKKARLSQEQLAERLDISVKHLSTLETGKVFASAELLEKIACELNVSLSALFYSPEVYSSDESTISKIDLIIEEEFKKAERTCKLRIHGMLN